ncbi:MAG: cell wall-binding repeat-containing protein, partial [Coriobacteriales bacterium]|nr:cell wall-binding repeat-containing protein [Coriobacteriales bacterium]
GGETTLQYDYTKWLGITGTPGEPIDAGESDSGTYPIGASVVILATPEDGTSFVFDHWEFSGPIEDLSSAYEPTASFTMPAEPVSVIPVFIDALASPYKLKIVVPNEGNGIVKLTHNKDLWIGGDDPDGTTTFIGDGSYPSGATVVVTAEPDTGYVFDYWELTGLVPSDLSDATKAQVSFFMPEHDVVLTPHFKLGDPDYNVRITPEIAVLDGDAHIIDGGFEVYDVDAPAGSEYWIQAVPIADYRFVEWISYVNGVPVPYDSPEAGQYYDRFKALTVFRTPANDVTLVPVFEREYTVSIYPLTSIFGGTANIIASGGTVDVEFTGPAGTTYTLTAEPDEGYRFVEWISYVDNVPVTPHDPFIGGAYTNRLASITAFRSPANDVMILPVFEPNDYRVTILTSRDLTGGDVTLATIARNGGEVAWHKYGESFVIEAQPLAGFYIFDQWTAYNDAGFEVPAGGVFADPQNSRTVLNVPAENIIVEATFTKITPTFSRLHGTSRYETSAAISRAALPGGTDTVILAVGTNYPDALAASALAGLGTDSGVDVPILLTAPGFLSTAARDEINRLGATNVIIVGGTAAVGASVEEELLLQTTATNITRYGGTDRYATALEIYQAGVGRWSNVAIIATSEGFADALSISPYAYMAHAPVFLAHSVTGLTYPEALAISTGRFDKIIIVGGTAVVPALVERQIFAMGVMPDIERLGGADRYETSTLIAKFTIEHVGPAFYDSVAVATGLDFPDALSGGALAGINHTVLLLADETTSNGYHGIDNFLRGNKDSINTGYVLGGPSAVSYDLLDEINSIWTPQL